MKSKMLEIDNSLLANASFIAWIISNLMFNDEICVAVESNFEIRRRYQRSVRFGWLVWDWRSQQISRCTHTVSRMEYIGGQLRKALRGWLFALNIFSIELNSKANKFIPIRVSSKKCDKSRNCRWLLLLPPFTVVTQSTYASDWTTYAPLCVPFFV